MSENITPEQYKMQIMKRNFANRVADYEEALATIQTQLQMAQQQLERYEEVEQPPEDAETQVAAPLPPP